jgi:glycosyltransferase involved in cell wall biosynthesis
MVVLIPAFEPDERLVELVESFAVIDAHLPIVIVDDGSGPAYDAIFDCAAAVGCHVVGNRLNRGKGFALKAGFAEIVARFPDHDVVCADCDGQHTVGDILQVAGALGESAARIVLGSRSFVGDVPAKSRLGNDLTRIVFRISTGLLIADTQTGLRAYPSSMLPWLQQVAGDRFEYELSVLLAAREAGFDIAEVPIETIYLDGNHSTHFRPVRDSIRVYLPLLKFAMSSLVSFTKRCRTRFRDGSPPSPTN